MQLGLLAFYACMTAAFELPDVAFRIYCITFLEFSPSQFALLASTTIVPWSVKPVWGFLIDNSSHLVRSVIFCVVGFVMCWCLVALEVTVSVWSMTLNCTFQSFFLCYLDVIADSELVKRVKKEDPDDVGTLQSHVWTCRAVGSLLASLIGGVLANYLSMRHIGLITGFVIVPGSIALSSSIERQQGCGWSTVQNKVRILRRTISQDNIRKPLIFIFCVAAMPSCGFAMMYFFQNGLLFTPMQFAIISASEHIAHLLGAVLFRLRLRKVSFRKIFYGGIALLVIMRLLQLVLICQWNHKLRISDIVFAVGEGVAYSIVAQIMTMPMCVLGARLCPGGIEASLYSTLMAVSNLGGLVSSYAGAALTEAFAITNNDFTNLWKLSLLCTGLSIVPVAFVHFLPNVSAANAGGDMELVERCIDEEKTTHDGEPGHRSVRQIGQQARVSHAHCDTQELQNA